jgi:hypothetical protein
MRRRQRAANINADRNKRLRAVRKKLLAAVGLKPPLSAADELRIETACWTQMAIDNQRNAIAGGRLIDIAGLERATTALNALLPSPSHELNVRFIDGSDVCVKCKAPLPPKEEREPVKAEAPALQPVSAPPTPAPAPPANVVALHKDIHAGARHN